MFPSTMKVKVTQLCLTLSDPMVYTVHGILQARILEWVAVPFFRGPSQRRNWTLVSCIAGRFFTMSHQGSPRHQLRVNKQIRSGFFIVNFSPFSQSLALPAIGTKEPGPMQPGWSWKFRVFVSLGWWLATQAPLREHWPRWGAQTCLSTWFSQCCLSGH